MSIEISCDECGQAADGIWLEKPLCDLPPLWSLTLRFYKDSKEVLEVLCDKCASERWD